MVTLGMLADLFLACLFLAVCFERRRVKFCDVISGNQSQRALHRQFVKKGLDLNEKGEMMNEEGLN